MTKQGADYNTSYDTNKIICLECKKKSLSQAGNFLVCGVCKKNYEVFDGVPVLLRNADMRTKLDEVNYDEKHGIVSEEIIKSVSGMWEHVFESLAISSSAVMEIGCGTGQLTHCLAHGERFESIHAVDISYKFINIARRRVGSDGAAAHYYICDAHHLPFAENSFDVVVGNSVLHHFLDYQNTLADINRILTPGGYAIFFEPVMQGKARIAMMLHLITMIEKRTNYGVLDDVDMKKIKMMRHHMIKSLALGNDRAKIAAMEDKYIFDIQEMKALSAQLGYSDFLYQNFHIEGESFSVGLAQHLALAGISKEKYEQYLFIARAYHENMHVLLPKEQYTPMGFFIFKK